jgi:threonyl-tRNA synthetase
MREEQIKKVPIMLVLGNNERDERTVTLRLHGEEQKNMTLDEFLSYVKEKNDSKALDL